ncbi:MAG: LysR family transcriptional regulator [Elusimicrobia bacterium]|nr:LysR family transcriptional regulator [Elusimicrobiota bacterium]
MLPINYHHLYYFWTAAKSGSIAAATKEIYLAQPTLSLQIKRLEDFLGKRLLIRGREGVSLTHEGRIAFEHCERLFHEGQELLSALGKGKKTSPVAFRLGMVDSVPREIVLQVLNSIEKRDPLLKVNLLGGSTEAMRESLKNYALDLVISHVDFSIQMRGQFRSRRVGRIPVFFVAAPQLEKKMRWFPSGLRGAAVLLRPSGNPIRAEVERFLKRHRLEVSLMAETEDSDLIQTLAVQGKGVAALDALSLEHEIRRKRLVKLHKNPTGILLDIWFWAGRRPQSNPGLNRVMEGLMERFVIDV